MKYSIITAAVAAALAVPAMADNKVQSVEFTATPAPLTATEQTHAYTKSSAIITYKNGKKKTFPLSYNVLYHSGDEIGGWKAGSVVDQTGAVLQYAVIDEKGTTARGPFHAKAPDANSLLQKDDAIFLVTQFEYDTEGADLHDPTKQLSLYGALPMPMNLANIKQDQHGTLSVVGLKNISMAGVGGLWIPCAGELTPWNTHLGGEEYEPDAQSFQNKPLTAMNLFTNTAGLTAAQGGAKPYNYGLAFEVMIDKKGNSEVVKHYAMGRIANELAHVMPDGRTVYKGDDGRDVMLAMFVADQRGNLSAGTLYAAKLEQLDAAKGGTFNLRWIKLGHSSDNEIKIMVDSGIAFSDIFDVVNKASYQANPSAYADFHPVYSYTGTGGSTQLEYLKLKAGMEKAAAFLETRRYAAYLGATTEFTKMEGETSNVADKKLYIAMSYVQKGMLAGQNSDRPNDDIHLTDDPKDLECGVVYESNLTGKQTDTAGERIHSHWVASDMHGLVLGAKKPATQTSYGKYDKCDTDKLANPDNIKYSAAMRTLFIGEDSGNHFNNFLWAYNVDNKNLVRIATTRAGAEWTGLQAVENMNDFAYIMSNIQHPGAAEDLSGYKAALTADGIDFETFRTSIDQRGAVGYLGGLPAIEAEADKSHNEDERK
jgi:hypothetical protein